MAELDLLTPVPQSLDRIWATHDVTVGGRPGDAATAFTMFVPKGWFVVRTFGSVEVGLGVPEALAGFLLQPVDESPVIAVTLTRVGGELGVEDLLRLRCAVEGYSVVDARWGAGLYGPRLQVAARQRDRSGGDQLRIMTGIVDDGRLFTVDVRARERWWQELHPQVWPSGLSFGPRVVTGVERLGRTKRVAGAKLACEVPVHWDVVRSSRGIALELRRSGAAIAWLHVTDAPDGAPTTHVRRVHRRLRSCGAEILGTEALAAPTDGAGTPSGWQLACEYQARWQRRAFSVRSGLRAIAGRMVEFVAIGPSVAADLQGWLWTKRAFDLAALGVTSSEITRGSSGPA